MADYQQISELSFGLVLEGPTDYQVIKNILFGFLEEDDLDLRPIQPPLDQTDKIKEGEFGGWENVIRYCSSKNFKTDIQILDFIIIQIDTDVCEEYNVPKIEKGKELSVEQLIGKVTARFREIIGTELFDELKDRIIFAVSVHSIECWLLPLFEHYKQKISTKGCLKRLNDILAKKNMNKINENSKAAYYYEEISDPYSKHKVIKKCYKHNPSLKIFVENIEEKLQIKQ